MSWSSFGSVDRDGDPDILYYNCDIISNRTIDQGVGTDPLAKFIETRDTAVIKDASKYNFSIVRFAMSGANKDLPLFIPSIQTGQSDINLTIYSVSFRLTYNYGGGLTGTITAQRFVQYSPETVGASIPNVPTDFQDLNTQYYWVYTYQHWLDLVNQTIVDCILDPNPVTPGYGTDSLERQLQALGVPAGSIVTEPPRIVWNGSGRNTFSIYADTYGFGGSARRSVPPVTPEEDFEMFFNSNSYGLFANFNNLYYGTDQPLGLDNEIIIQPIGFNSNIFIPTATAPPSTTPPAASKTYWEIEQDYESVSSLWSPIASIVFCSTLLPVINEQVGLPVTYGNGSTSDVGSTSQSAFQPIVTDISLPLEAAHNYRQFIQYTPTAEYRIASFTSSKQEIRNIDVQVFWKNRLDNKLYPITMFNQSSINVKMMFRRRGIEPPKGY